MHYKQSYIALILCFAYIPTYAAQLQLLQLNSDLTQLQSTTSRPPLFIAQNAIGFAEDPNVGYRSTMEDAHAFVVKSDYAFFGLYDGHGGRAVADFAAEHLHEYIINALKGKPPQQFTDMRIRKILNDAFVKTHQDLDKAAFDAKEQGCTAVAVLLYDNKIYAANAGDSRAVLGSSGQAIALTDDHKPDRPDEKERIEKLGGKVIIWGVPRVNGDLAISRSLGDKRLHPYVIPNPEIKQANLTSAHEFLIIACDGIWDVINNQQAVDIVRTALQQSKNVNQAADILKNEALKRGSTDNVTVIVVDLRHIVSESIFAEMQTNIKIINDAIARNDPDDLSIVLTGEDYSQTLSTAQNFLKTSLARNEISSSEFQKKSSKLDTIKHDYIDAIKRLATFELEKNKKSYSQNIKTKQQYDYRISRIKIGLNNLLPIAQVQQIIGPYEK